MDPVASWPTRVEIRTSFAHVDDVLGSSSAIERGLSWLSPAERERFSRYRHDIDRRMFLLGRVMARSLVGRALGVEPLSWPWTENARGRPGVGSPATPLCFNLAHSAGLVVCAVSRDRLVGVDVEFRYRRAIDPRLVGRYCAPAEVADIEGRDVPDRQDQFLRYWTLKEAYLKALGLGIAVHLADVSFSLEPDIRIGFLNSLAGESTDWAFHLTTVGDGHFVAVAAPGSTGGVPQFTIEPFQTGALAG